MKWIKASERLPNKKGWYIVRDIGSETNYCDNKLFNPNIDTADRLSITNGDVEWLDESQSPSDNQEELWDAVIEEVLNDSSFHNKELPGKLKSKFTLHRKQQ